MSHTESMFLGAVIFLLSGGLGMGFLAVVGDVNPVEVPWGLVGAWVVATVVCSLVYLTVRRKRVQTTRYWSSYSMNSYEDSGFEN